MYAGLAVWTTLAVAGNGSMRTPPTATEVQAPRIETVNIRGHQLQLRIYGTPNGAPVIVSSGDGGWIHLGPHVAEVLADRGFYVIGFDVRAYLEAFTSRTTALAPDNEPDDYKILIDYAARATGRRPVLIGVSEGAGLSVLAATAPGNRDAIAGVVGLGLSNLTELGWRWKDMIIYVTHRAPDEPTFSVAQIVDRLKPLPLAAIHSTHDEFVPLSEVQTVLARTDGPKRLWTVSASDHRFSGNVAEFDRSLFEALAWIASVRTPEGK
jgi:pimeloyl-ACP methyl ester carboxylesterase